MSAQSKISSKHAGETAESAVLQEVPELEYVPDREDVHVDARTTAAIAPRDELATVALPVIAIDTLIEIKSVMAVYGENQSRGRFYLRKKQHEYLAETNSVYIFAVCAPVPDRPVIALKAVPASIVEDLVSSWIDAGDRPDYAQIAWSRVFEPDEVSRNGGDQR